MEPGQLTKTWIVFKQQTRLLKPYYHEKEFLRLIIRLYTYATGTFLLRKLKSCPRIKVILIIAEFTAQRLCLILNLQ